MKDSRVIFITGPSGAGKSCLATSLAKSINYHQLSLDAIRQKKGGDTRRAWLQIWKAIRNGERVVVDSTGASRIFRLVYRAAVFEHSSPIVISLRADEKCLRSRRQQSETLRPIFLSDGKQISERYLADAGGATQADLAIDTTRMSRKQVLNKVLTYLQRN
jgi:shikimate kinase